MQACSIKPSLQTSLLAVVITEIVYRIELTTISKKIQTTRKRYFLPITHLFLSRAVQTVPIGSFWCTGLDLSLANLICKELPTTNWIQLTAHLGFEPMESQCATGCQVASKGVSTQTPKL